MLPPSSWVTKLLKQNMSPRDFFDPTLEIIIGEETTPEERRGEEGAGVRLIRLDQPIDKFVFLKVPYTVVDRHLQIGSSRSIRRISYVRDRAVLTQLFASYRDGKSSDHVILRRVKTFIVV